MKAYLLNVGAEVLSGKVINANASFLASELESLGIEVIKTLVVGDDDQQIGACVDEFINSDCSLLITTGGLGPTHDDITKEAICNKLGLKLVYNEVASLDMLNYFKQVKNDCNVKQAYYPQGSLIISNEIGSADGVIIPFGEKTIIMLVGPHLEMQHLFNKGVRTYLAPFAEKKLLKDYTVCGESESYFENILAPLITKYPQVVIAPYASLGSIRYRIIAPPEQESLFTKVNEEFSLIMGDYIISQNNQTIETVLVELLRKKKLTLSCAESITGGLLAKKITAVPHASEVFSRSFVTYDLEAKSEVLGLPLEFFNTHDQVSEATVRAMLKGLRKITNSSLLMVISGYAGPGGKEVGLVWAALAYQNKEVIKKWFFQGNREMIRTKAANNLLYQAYLLIKEDYKNE